MKIKSVFHQDHGVTLETLAWALTVINPGSGFFLKTIELPSEHDDLTSNLYGPSAGDPPVANAVWAKRDPKDEFRGETPFVDAPPRPTRLLTVIGEVKEDGEALIYTAYGGPAAMRIPSDPHISGPDEKAASEKFWSEHALSSAAKVR